MALSLIASATVVDPTLTSVMHPSFEMGQEAAHLLLRQMRGEKPTAAQIVMKTKMVIRESTTLK
jgi:LacI family transcriptional regulator